MARRSVGNRSFRLRPFEWTLSLSLGDVCGGTRLSSLGSRSFIHSLSGDGDVRLSLSSLSVLFCLSVHLRSPASSYELFTFAFAFAFSSSTSAPNTHTVFLPVHVSLTVSVFRFTERTAVPSVLCSVFAYRLIRCVNCLKCAQLNCAVLLRVLSLSLSTLIIDAPKYSQFCKCFASTSELSSSPTELTNSAASFG